MSLPEELRQPSLEQVVKNHVKVLRAAIRLKHSIEADNEIAAMLPAVRMELNKQLQQGKVKGLSVAEMLELVEGKPE